MIKYKLTDLVDEATLQSIQDFFLKVTGMPCTITDSQGKAVTGDNGYCDFCSSLIKASELGKKRCELCAKKGVLESLKNGKASIYYCHSKLVEFAVPVLVSGELIGGITGGQVRLCELDKEIIEKKAEELALCPENYAKKFNQTPAFEKSKLTESAACLWKLAEVISSIALSNMYRIEKQVSSENRARNQTLFITDMAVKIKQSMKAWLASLNSVSSLSASSQVSNDLQRIISEGRKTDASLTNFVDYIKITEGATTLIEDTYSLREYLPQTIELLEKELIDKDISISFEIDSSVPPLLFGDYGRIAQIVIRLAREAISRMDVGYIRIKASCTNCAYAKMLEVSVTDSNEAFSEQAVNNIKQYFDIGISALIGKNLTKELGYPMIAMLLRQLSGTMEIQNKREGSTVFTFKIPQLSIDKNGKRA